MRDYSSNGEQKILHEQFEDIFNGFFIEVGSNDGLKASNARSFYEKGWSGISIEADPETYKNLENNYLGQDRVKLMNVAVADFDGTAKFFAERGRCNSGWSTMSEQYRDHIITDKNGANRAKFEEVKVPAMTVKSILEKHGNPKVDAFIMDAEGMDRSIVESLDFKDFRPTVFMSEINKKGAYQPIMDHMKKHGYKLLSEIGGNGIWRDKES